MNIINDNIVTVLIRLNTEFNETNDNNQKFKYNQACERLLHKVLQDFGPDKIIEVFDATIKKVGYPLKLKNTYTEYYDFHKKIKY